VRDVGTDAQESLPGAAIFDRVLRFLDSRNVKLDGDDSRPGIEQAKCHGPTQTAPGSGDNRDFSVKNSGHCPRHVQSIQVLRCEVGRTFFNSFLAGCRIRPLGPDYLSAAEQS
jgi:hypothetical protein